MSVIKDKLIELLEYKDHEIDLLSKELYPYKNATTAIIVDSNVTQDRVYATPRALPWVGKTFLILDTYYTVKSINRETKQVVLEML